MDENRLGEIGTLGKKIDELRRQVAELELAYQRAGSNLATTVAGDLADIKEAREEATRIASFLQGTELFGRYAQDADRHRRVANRWRMAAVLILVVTSAAAISMTQALSLSTGALVGSLTPALGLFVYASLESHNHRRREFDRRRIALRVSAIEGYTKQRREAGTTSEKENAERLLYDFVRKHFIDPELDSNDMAYPAFSIITITERRRGGGEAAATTP